MRLFKQITSNALFWGLLMLFHDVQKYFLLNVIFLTIFLFKTSKEKYKRRLWLPIATVVVNIAFSILFFIENNFQIFSIIISVVLLAASFLIIWDIVEEKKRIEAED